MSHRLPLFQQSGVFLLTLLVTAAAVLVALRQVGLPLLGIDDAHIFLVYGKNLTSGAGLVYNQGGERVEGFSSLLWLLVIALGYLAFPSPEKYLLIVSVLLVSGAIAIVTYTRVRYAPSGVRLTRACIFGLPEPSAPTPWASTSA